MLKYILRIGPLSSDPGAPVTQPNIWTQRHKRSLSAELFFEPALEHLEDVVRDVNFSETFKGMQSNSANEGKKEGISAALCSVWFLYSAPTMHQYFSIRSTWFSPPWMLKDRLSLNCTIFRNNTARHLRKSSKTQGNYKKQQVVKKTQNQILSPCLEKELKVIMLHLIFQRQN